MAELEKSGLVRLESSGDLILKELGGTLWNELPQINTKLQNGITNYLKFFWGWEIYGYETRSKGGLFYFKRSFRIIS